MQPIGALKSLCKSSFIGERQFGDPFTRFTEILYEP